LPILPISLIAVHARHALGALCCCLCLATAAIAQDTPKPAQSPAPPVAPGTEITVATRIIAPFVIKEGAGLSGFSVDLWNAIGTELGIKSRFVTYDMLPKLLEAVRGGQNHVGIAAISITSKRGETLEFSQPMFRSGLSIMVPANGHSLDVMGIMLSSGMLKAIGIFLLILLIPAHIIWFLARGRDDGLPISQKYIPGIFDAVFWCAESMGGAAQAHPRRIFARLAAIIWIYAGIVLISYFTAFATTSLTMQTLRGEINGPGDLRNKRVAAVEGSTSATYAGELGATIGAYKNFDAAAEAVLNGKAQAAVYDTPIIMYYAKNEPRVQIAGPQFRPESYGIAFPLGSPLRRPVDQALLKLVENGTYDSLYRKWFGQAEGGG
jgi:polar amino acid transport system substrate-binding protein